MTESGGRASGRPPDAPAGEGLLTLARAAAYLGLPTDAVRALVDARFLRPAREGPDGPLLDRGELRAFMTWDLGDEPHDDHGLDLELEHLQVHAGGSDLEALLAALASRTGQMAHQALDMFAQVFPEAQEWSAEDRSRFVEQAKGRLEAILAVTEPGEELDSALGEELRGVGAGAAGDGAPLPQLLIVLRISRDLVVQTAVELAGEQGDQWGLALALLLTRVLPAVDRLTDSLAQGYWSAVIGRQKEARARYEHVVEHASDGVYEVDAEGRIQYANPQLGIILGRRRLDELEGSLLLDVMAPLGGTPAQGVLVSPAGGSSHVEITVARPDGVQRTLDVRTVARMAGGELVGYQGVVRDVTAAHELGAQKGRLQTSLLDDLRLSLVRLADLGAGLEAEGERLSPEELRDIGAAVAGHGQHLASLAESLSRTSVLAAGAPLLNPRPLDLVEVVRAALSHTAAAGHRLDVEVPAGLKVMADSENLERVVRAIVDTAIGPGDGPVKLEVEAAAEAELQLRISAGRTGSEAGELALEKLLVEAMGGRLWHQSGPDGRGFLHLALPVPNRRRGDDVIRL